jgi:hypothetical protein
MDRVAFLQGGVQEIDPTACYGHEAIDARIKKHGRELLVLRKAL